MIVMVLRLEEGRNLHKHLRKVPSFYSILKLILLFLMGMTYGQRTLNTKNVPERCPKESRSEVICNPCPTNRNSFYQNYKNKENFAKTLGEYLKTKFKNLNEDIIRYLLFAHAFTGCDTTSTIHKFGKTTIFKKLNNLTSLQSIVETI